MIRDNRTTKAAVRSRCAKSASPGIPARGLKSGLIHGRSAASGAYSFHRRRAGRGRWWIMAGRTAADLESVWDSSRSRPTRERLSNQMSNNRHRQQWTPADTHGQSVPGHACCGAGSPRLYLASGRRGQCQHAHRRGSHCSLVKLPGPTDRQCSSKCNNHADIHRSRIDAVDLLTCTNDRHRPRCR